MSLMGTFHGTNSDRQFDGDIDLPRRRLVAIAMIGSVGCIPSASLGALGSGEWFTIGIAGNLSQPKLLEGQLVAVDSKVWSIDQVGDFFSYTSQDNLSVPETFILRWRSDGDTQVRERAIRTRSQLPVDVKEKLASKVSPPYAIILNFRVRHGKPDCVWSFSRLGGSGGGRLIAEGTIDA